jgi:hypothetical protein
MPQGSFVLGKYVKDRENLEKVGWLPMKERRELHLLQQTFKAIHFPNWPQYLSLEQSVNERNLRSQGSIRLKVPLENKTFQDNASKLFNSLPIHIRNCKDFNIFTKLTKDFLSEQK